MQDCNQNNWYKALLFHTRNAICFPCIDDHIDLHLLKLLIKIFKCNFSFFVYKESPFPFLKKQWKGKNYGFNTSEQ